MHSLTCMSVVVCVVRKPRPCNSYSRRRDRINTVLWRSYYKGGRGYVGPEAQDPPPGAERDCGGRVSRARVRGARRALLCRAVPCRPALCEGSTAPLGGQAGRGVRAAGPEVPLWRCVCAVGAFPGRSVREAGEKKGMCAMGRRQMGRRRGGHLVSAHKMWAEAEGGQFQTQLQTHYVSDPLPQSFVGSS